MIKTFEQFVNENYNEKISLAYGEEYGSPLFNEISESLMSEIQYSINEGRLVIDANMIEEGLFDKIGSIFKKGADKASQKSEKAEEEINLTQDWMKDLLSDPTTYSKELVSNAKEVKSLVREKKIYDMIDSLCKSAEELCLELSEKEDSTYKTITEKMTAANKAIKDFTNESIDKINEIVTESKDKVSDVLATVYMFCQRMFDFVKKSMVKVGEGVVFGLTLPILFAYAVYKGTLKVCGVLVEKVKDGANFVKTVFNAIKETVVEWVIETLKKAKEHLKTACDNIKDGAKSAYAAIGKTYLSIVATLGQLASDAKDKMTEAYNDFVESVKEFSDEVKEFVSEKWNVVSKWCKKTATSFAEGVKNVWDKTKEKVMAGVDAVKDAYQALSDEADATWNDIKKWSDDKQQSVIKATMKYAADKWGKDEVMSWL